MPFVSRFASLEVRLGAGRLRLDEFEADFGDAVAGEVLVDYAEGVATVHVLGVREIADGSLTCSIDGTRRAMVAMDLGFLRRILAEAESRASDAGIPGPNRSERLPDPPEAAQAAEDRGAKAGGLLRPGAAKDRGAGG